MRLSAQQRDTLESMALGLLFVLCAFVITPVYKLLYNPTESAPVGWYLFKTTHVLRVGELVLAKLPAGSADLANERGYLPRSVPLLKHVAALEGQSVCRQGNLITIDDIVITHALERDGAGRALPTWTGCRTLKPDEVFLLSTDSPLSFDSRYFGPVEKSAVLGEAMPLWTR